MNLVAMDMVVARIEALLREQNPNSPK